MNRVSAPTEPCPDHQEACLLSAWGVEESPNWTAHLESCSRCREAQRETVRFAEGCEAAVRPPPEVLNRVTWGAIQKAAAKPRLRERRDRRLWLYAGAGAVAAFASLLVYVSGGRRDEGLPPGLELAELDPQFLQDMELAEHLEVLEVLDALEELADG
jgi:hypothetical protein